MRRALIVLAVVGALPVAAQQLELFTARQGSSAALRWAQQGGFSDAVLVGVFYAGVIPGNVGLSPRFDLETGKANYWGYALRSAARDTVLFAVVIRVPFLGFQVFPIAGFPGLPVSEPLPEWWMDSDTLVFLLRTEQTFGEFRRRYPDSLPDFITLGMGLLPGMPGLLPLWTMTFLGSPEDPAAAMTCTAWRDAQGQYGSQCVGGPSAVWEPAAEEVRLFPQPAHRWVTLEVAPPLCDRLSQVWLEDMLGRRVQGWAWTGCRQHFHLQCTAGLYSVVLVGPGQRYRVPLLVAP